MKSTKTSHGSVAVLDQSDIRKLSEALSVVEEILHIETENRGLHIRNCPEAAAAHACLTLLLRSHNERRFTKEEALYEECAT